jgi:hypothetical protein
VDLPCQANLLRVVGNRDTLREFKYINTRVNHVELNEVVADMKPIAVSADELRGLKADLDTKGEHYTFKTGKMGICSISTASCVYSVNSHYNDVVSAFEQQYGIGGYVVDALKNEALVEFIKEGVHYNTVVDLWGYEKLVQMKDELMHLDQKKAYAQFRSCPWYMGFLGKITDFRSMDGCSNKIAFAIENVGLYRVGWIDIPDSPMGKWLKRLDVYRQYGVYASPEIKFLNSIRVDLDIVEGCWGVSAFDMEFPENMVDKEAKTEDGVSYYAKWVGSCDIMKWSKKIYMNGSKEYFQDIKHHVDSNVNVWHYDDGTGCIEYPKSFVPYRGHITAFITAYQRLHMFYQLSTMDVAKVYRIITDGIYYTPHDFTVRDTFAFKQEVKIGNLGADDYVSNLPHRGSKLLRLADASFIPNHRVSLYNGEGGTGKTYTIMSDEGYINVLFVCPSWKLARKVEEEYGVPVSVLARVSCESEEALHYRRKYNVVVCDEVSQYTQGEVNKLIKFWGEHKIYFLGDIVWDRAGDGTVCYQTPAFTGDGVSMDTFNYVRTFSTDHRCKCDGLKGLKNKLREMIYGEVWTKKVNEYVVGFATETGRGITAQEVDSLYAIEDYILTSKCRCNKHHDEDCNCDGKNFRKQWTQLFAGQFSEEKYLVQGKTEEFSRGDVVISIDKPPYGSVPATPLLSTLLRARPSGRRYLLICDSCLNPSLYTRL